ncbi:MAG TPA: metallophosphoesterase [Armatimonadota bacterium]|jgi:hypothetical protein
MTTTTATTPPTKRRKIRWRLFVLLVLCALFLYARFIEPNWVAVERVSLSLPHLPADFNGLRVVQLSDIHYPDSHNPQFFRGVVERVNRLKPDLIVLTGDYISSGRDNIAPCAQMLGGLHAPLGVVAVLGNHDYWTDGREVTRALSANGIRALRNASVALSRGNARLWIVGIDDAWKGFDDFATALHGIPASEAKIVLLHEPDFAVTTARYPVDLQLSGHSHGGQVRLPGIGGLHYPPYSKIYPMGYYHVGALQLYVNRGLGLIVPFRFDCRPEITLLTLQRATP